MTASTLGDAVLLDLDGVVWRGDQPIPGADRAIAQLRDEGVVVSFFTNNSFPLLSSHLEKLARFGVVASASQLLTSAQAAASCCEPGESVLVLGGPGILEALGDAKLAGRAITDELEPTGPAAARADVVVVGIDPQCTYRRLAVAYGAIAAGARFVATNDDATFPLPDGTVPGAGALVAALSYATGVAPLIAGKPHEPAAALVRLRLGEVSVVVGDRPSTDGRLASLLGARFALVLSGVTPAGHGALEVEPALEAADLATLVERAFGDGR